MVRTATPKPDSNGLFPQTRPFIVFIVEVIRIMVIFILIVLASFPLKRETKV